MSSSQSENNNHGGHHHHRHRHRGDRGHHQHQQLKHQEQPSSFATSKKLFFIFGSYTDFWSFRTISQFLVVKIQMRHF